MRTLLRILLATAGLAAAAIAAPLPAAADGPLQEGSLDWGVKASFRSYITGPIALGSVTPGGGATANGDGTFRFPLREGSTAGGSVTAAFGGSVHFSGHLGALDLRITDPRVELAGGQGTLVVDATSKHLETGAVETFDDVVLAHLDLSGVSPTEAGGQRVHAAIPAVLTAEGAAAFAGFYKAGDALDPLTLTLTPAAGGDGGGGGGATPTTATAAPTTAPSDAVGCTPTTAVAGGPIAYCASGFAPGEQVQVLVHASSQQLWVATADADGAVPRATATLPATLAPGSHKLELRGITTGRSLVSPEFTVTAAGASAAAQVTTSVGATLADTGWGTVALGLLSAVLLAFGLALTRLTRTP